MVAVAAASAALAVILGALAWALGARETLAQAEDWVRPVRDVPAGGGARGALRRVGALLPTNDRTAAVITQGLESVGWRLTVPEWQALHVVTAASLAAVIGVCARLTLHGLVFVAVGFAVGGVAGWPLPDTAWLLAVRRRRARVDAEILPFVDLLGMLSSAGLGFEGAVARACEDMPGVLAAEFRRVLVAREYHALSSGAALKALAERLGHPEVRHLAEVVADGVEAGRGLPDALEAAAAGLRSDRMQAIERKAQGQAMSSSVLLVLAALLPTALMILYPSFRLMSKAF